MCFLVGGVGAIRQEGPDQRDQVVHNLHKSATVPEGAGEDYALWEDGASHTEDKCCC